jgi:hypothetical protein
MSKVQPGSWVYDRDLQSLVPKYGRNYFEQNEKRSDLPCPAIRPDSMRPIKSMADGRVYDGKSAYYKSVARAGCEIVGFDKRWQEHIKAPQPFGGEKAHEADLVRDVKAATEIEQSKVPSYGPEARRLMRKQKRAARSSK